MRHLLLLAAVLLLPVACESGPPPTTHDGGDSQDAGATQDAGPDLSTCLDGVRNGQETDTDCGGGCASCPVCLRCAVDADCETGNCASGSCGALRQGLPGLDPTRRTLRNLVTTVELGMRCDMGLYLDVLGVVGREAYRFSEKEPRYTSELLGQDETQLHADAFYLARPWESRYWVARNARLLQETSARAPDLSVAEKKGFAAFARTVLAHQLLLNLTLSDTNGLRVDVEDAQQPILSRDDALAHVASLLDDAQADLTIATFSFPLSSGLSAFSTPESFARLNRALAARVAAYRGQWPLVLTLLNESFFALNGDLDAGAYFPFSDAPGDLTNPLFLPQNSTGEVRVAHPSFATEGAAGDSRLTKATLRAAPASQAGLSSNRDVWRYTSPLAPIPLIRNEELVLLYAEARVQTSAVADAIVAINRIRTSHNLGVYAGGIGTTALLNEVLTQRRYSLFLEGHRWVDMRRHGRLAELPTDRAGDDVWSAFPIP